MRFSGTFGSNHAEWARKISTENASEEFQLGSEHLVCRAAERHRTTTERSAQITIVIWKAVWIGLFVINRDSVWRDIDWMKPANQRLVEPRMLAVLHTLRLEATSPVIATEHARSVSKVVRKTPDLAAEIGKLGCRLETNALISPNALGNNDARQSYADFLKLCGTCLRNLLQGVSGVPVNINAIITAHTATAGQLTS